ncbi:MAG TPA: phosphotransferase family protein [Cyclobacteriaceae bacterium]
MSELTEKPNKPAIDQPVQARSEESPNIERLNSYLQSQGFEIGQVLSVLQFPSGYSNLTFCLNTASGEYILRRPPIGANIKSAHDMGREFKVLTLLKKYYPIVPTPIAYCDTDEIIGSPFYVMERLQGVVLRAGNASKLGITPQQFKSVSESLVDNFVKLHDLDIQSTGLDQLGKPDGYVQRQVEGWSKRYFTAATDDITEMNLLADWLQKNQPISQSPTFLHNDYKYDNVILDPQNLSTIMGVLDWEMSTVGDPLMDVGASIAYWSEAGDDPILQSFNLTALAGNLTRKQFIDRYAEKSKRDISNILFYYAFGLFKNAVIAQQIYTRWKQGLTKDARFGGLLMVIKALAKQGVNSLNKGTV